MAKISELLGLVLLGLVMMVFAYFASFIGIGFQLLIGGIGGVFIVVGILGLFDVVISRD